ncbi:hypothetical protein TNCV_4386261 [Trichonephila clavipes]|nr:hypothetical protein TNCV_4386261 [Trichonephila clavipes]
MSVVPCLNTSSSYYQEKRIANDDFQQVWCSRNLSFHIIYLKTAWRNHLERQESHAASVSGLLDDFWS